ncbi:MULTISPECIES: hypothetical protein [unclassified Streptomyces]|uniref:hypothetical protein n=1 Tax=unclassified Streptomyces TaxID=2593676 RepID=UPI002E2D4DE3|nr:hypothetical protein [Streptomyces sp. NBC_00223]
MSDTTASASRAAWAVPAAVNTVLGCVGTFPLGLLWTFLADHPLASIGLTHRDPTDNDGVLPWLVLLILVVGVYCALWAAANIAVRRWTRLPGRPYWVFTVIVTLVPATVFAIFPDLWQALERS